jgi:ClpP class serine protease
MTSYDRVHAQIKEALSDNEIETILLDIDSPGGEVSGIFDWADFIYEARKSKEKNILAIANDDAYSAAYAIDSSAEKVFVSRTSGVIASHINQSRFDEKQGIIYTTVFAGKRKNDLSPHKTITSQSLESLQEEINRLYEMFIRLIARNRNLSIETIRSTEAELYFGKNEIEIGLADGIKTFAELINKHRNKSFTMNEQATADYLIAQGKRLGREGYHTEVLELIRLCNLSRMPEKIGEFIEQNVSAKQAQEILLSILAERTMKTEILSTLPQISPEDLVMQAAKARQNA